MNNIIIHYPPLYSQATDIPYPQELDSWEFFSLGNNLNRLSSSTCYYNIMTYLLEIIVNTEINFEYLL